MKKAGGTAVIVRFPVADHNPRRACRTLQSLLEQAMLEWAVKSPGLIIHAPEVLAAELQKGSQWKR